MATVRRDEPKVGRNDPCPCGSGKKYKKCHGAAAYFADVTRLEDRKSYVENSSSHAALDRSRHRHRADVRRRAAGAAALRRRADTGGRQYPVDATDTARGAAAQRGDGHRYRIEAGHRHGAARRPRRDPQEPVDRRTGVRSGSGEAFRERHDRQSDHAVAQPIGSTKRST